jgi:hypothetical protein
MRAPLNRNAPAAEIRASLNRAATARERSSAKLH